MNDIRNFKAVSIICTGCDTKVTIPITKATELIEQCPNCRKYFAKDAIGDPVRLLALSIEAAKAAKGCEIAIECDEEQIKQGGA